MRVITEINDCSHERSCDKHECGWVFSGCFPQNCGDCDGAKTCQADDEGVRRCVASTCPNGCPANAKCVDSACVCPKGSKLMTDDDVCMPEASLSNTPPEDTSSYVTYGNGEWSTNLLPANYDFNNDTQVTIEPTRSDSDSDSDVEEVVYYVGDDNMKYVDLQQEAPEDDGINGLQQTGSGSGMFGVFVLAQ